MSIGRLLLVEDEPSLAQLLVRFLSRAGYDVVACASAAEAQAGWDDAFDIAVVDLGLPDMPGERLAAELLARSERITIVVSSGTPTEAASLGFPDEAISQGRVHVLQKPYFPGHLIELLSGIPRRGSDGLDGGDAG